MSTNIPVKPFHILIVDDDLVDGRLTKEAFVDGKIFASIDTVYDGMESMAHLHREGSYSHVPRPNLILLDLNTTSHADRDVIQTYDLGANAYVVEPVNLDQMNTIAQKIQIFGSLSSG